MIPIEEIVDAIVRESPKISADQARIMIREHLPTIIARQIVGMYWEKVAADQVRRTHPGQSSCVCVCGHRAEDHNSTENLCKIVNCGCEGFRDKEFGIKCYVCGHLKAVHTISKCVCFGCICTCFVGKCPECGGRMEEKEYFYVCNVSHDLGARKVFIAKKLFEINLSMITDKFKETKINSNI